MRSVRRWSDSDEPHASATDHLGTRASGPYVKAARRLGLRLVPGYAGLRPVCWIGTPSGSSAGTWVRGPPARMCGVRRGLPPPFRGGRGEGMRMEAHWWRGLAATWSSRCVTRTHRLAYQHTI